MYILVFVAHSDSIKNRVEFLMEAVLMADFDHKNVMWLIAIVIDDDMNPNVLLPLMDNGDLRSFIAKPSHVSYFIMHLEFPIRVRATVWVVWVRQL